LIIIVFVGYGGNETHITGIRIIMIIIVVGRMIINSGG